MDDVGRVAVADADEELLDPADRDRRRHRAVAPQLGVERLALQALEDEERLPLVEAEPDDVADVPALHTRKEHRLAREALAHLAAGLGRLEDLDRDGAAGRLVDGVVHARRRP